MTIYSPKPPQFCVYITTYFGSKLPMFYIGSGTISKINNGYRGSVSSKEYKVIFKQELKQNPHLFKIRVIKTFYSRKAATFYECIIQKNFKVAINPMFINRGYASKNFADGTKHTPETLKLFKFRRTATVTDELRESRRLHNLNKVTVFDYSENKYKRVDKTTSDYIFHISSGNWIPAGKLRNSKSRTKTSIASSDRKHYYNPETGVKICIKSSDIPPEGFILGISEEQRNNLAILQTNLLYFYNHITKEQVKCHIDNVPSGYIRGRINFGANGNSFKNDIVLYNLITKQTETCNKLNEHPQFTLYKSKKFVWIINNQFVSISPNSISFLVNTDLPMCRLVKDIDYYQRKIGCSLSDLNIVRILKEDYIHHEHYIWLK